MDQIKSLYQGRYLGLVERSGWEFATRTNASGVVILLALTDQRELVLVEQFRTPVACYTIELPAGLVGDHGDSGEPLLVAAERELLEETGFAADRFELLLSCPSSAGMSDEIVTFVRAHGLKRVSAGGGDDSEDIVVHLVPLNDVDSWVSRRVGEGVAVDPKIFGALYWLGVRAQGK